jgi:hypothetical protein
MSHFYASLTGSGKNTTTKTGTKTSGISGHVRGWNGGVKVIGMSREDNTDCFHIYSTGGSNGGTNDNLIGFVNNNGEFIPCQDDNQVHIYREKTSHV